jgi:hypothetical protein
VKYRPLATRQLNDLWRGLKTVNRARTAGKWDPDLMDFPPKDPDRAFLEFISEHVDEIIAEVEKSLCVLP